MDPMDWTASTGSEQPAIARLEPLGGLWMLGGIGLRILEGCCPRAAMPFSGTTYSNAIASNQEVAQTGTHSMARPHSSHVRGVQRWITGAVELLAAGALLTLLPVVLATSMLGHALTNLRPLGWLLLAAGAGLLLIQWKFSTAKGSSGGTRQGPKRTANTVHRTTRVVENSDEHRENPGVSKRVSQIPSTGSGQNVFEQWRRDPSIGEGIVPTTPTRWGWDVFELIEWRRFEAVVEALFAQAGFDTRSQSHGADGGVDVWLYARSDAEKPVSVVQCKHWVGKRVGVDKVRELKGVMASHGMTRGHFATTATFTSDAIKFAQQNGIHLLDIEGILRLIDKRPKKDQAALLAVATEGEFWRPTCVNCGTKLVARPGRPGRKPFWGCSSYPRCRTTMQMRAG